MSERRVNHEAVLLPTGKVLVSGGWDARNDYLTSCEIYDPQTETWRAAGSMNDARIHHKLISLNNGWVLAVGGFAYSGTSQFLSRCELYDPDTATWSYTQNLTHVRKGHTAFLLDDNRALVVGGIYHESYMAIYLKSCETFTYYQP